MKEISVTDRLTFLAESFDIFECGLDNTGGSSADNKVLEMTEAGYTPQLVSTTNGKVMAIISTKVNEKNRILKHISICSEVFTDMIVSDPTENKIYLQWMLTVFSRFLRFGEKTNILSAIRFVEEDLPQASSYLVLFEENKRKKKFKELCLSTYSLKQIIDPTNINQFKSLSQLFDAVDPFIEKEPSAVERTMQKFVDSGQALIPVKDRKFTLFIPKTTEANVVFDNFANWCTAKKGNGMFNSYTTRNKKPNGENSDIYIIVDNKFFTGESEEIYQIHFETNQIKNKSNSSNVNIYENILSESESLSIYFYETLMKMAKEFKQGIDQNKYLDSLIKFGFSESLFEMFPIDTPSIKIMKREIPKLPDMNRFKNIDQLIITDAKLVELHPSVCNLNTLNILVLTNNNIKTLPVEIGQLKNLTFLNVTGNQIKDFPSEIKYLDKSNGGSLYRLAVKEEQIGAENYQKLKRLLPETIIS